MENDKELIDMINAYFEKESKLASGNIYDADETPVDADFASRVVGLELREEKAEQIETVAAAAKKLCGLFPKAFIYDEENKPIKPGKVGTNYLITVTTPQPLLDIGSRTVKNLIADMIKASDRWGITRMGRKSGFTFMFTVSDIWQTYRVMDNNELQLYRAWYQQFEK